MSLRTDALADTIVAGLADGIPLRELCRNHGISKSEVYRWIDDDEELRGRIACARARGYDEIAESTIEIADDARNDWMDKHGADGEVVGRQLNAEHVQRSKLRIETRLKLLAKWDPRRYGDRQQTELSGPGGGPIAVAGIDVASITPEQLRALASIKLAGE